MALLIGEPGSQEGRKVDETLSDIVSKLAVIGCMDDRCGGIRHPIRRELQAPKRFPNITFAGSVHMLGEPEDLPHLRPLAERQRLYASAKDIVGHCLDLGIGGKGIRKLLICPHQDCLHVKWEGYQFATPEDEESYAWRSIYQAAHWIKDRFGAFEGLEVWGAYAYFLDPNHEFVDLKGIKQLF